ncbi:MAG: hypothetical protein ACTSQO_15185, partial [Candidatus Helarchaeota archaeon]
HSIRKDALNSNIPGWLIIYNNGFWWFTQLFFKKGKELYYFLLVFTSSQIAHKLPSRNSVRYN